MIKLDGVSFAYPGREDRPALSRVGFELERGCTLAVLGASGSGKSTLARLLNGLLVPGEGRVMVDGLNTADSEALPKIRRAVQIVFQNPENQQVGLTLGEDIAFGLSNIGWPQEGMEERIRWALELVGLEGEPERPVASLSGGERQKLSLASTLALGPGYLVLDEPTAMLDPASRKRFLASLASSVEALDLGIVYITHRVEEAMEADRWLVLDKGRAAAEGKPETLIEASALLEGAGIERPYLRALGSALRDEGVPAAPCPTIPQLEALACGSS